MSFNPTNHMDKDCAVDPDFGYLEDVDKPVYQTSTLLLYHETFKLYL
jgi:hypothetical protein